MFYFVHNIMVYENIFTIENNIVIIEFRDCLFYYKSIFFYNPTFFMLRPYPWSQRWRIRGVLQHFKNGMLSRVRSHHLWIFSSTQKLILCHLFDNSKDKIWKQDPLISVYFSIKIWIMEKLHRIKVFCQRNAIRFKKWKIFLTSSDKVPEINKRLCVP